MCNGDYESNRQTTLACMYICFLVCLLGMLAFRTDDARDLFLFIGLVLMVCVMFVMIMETIQRIIICAIRNERRTAITPVEAVERSVHEISLDVIFDGQNKQECTICMEQLSEYVNLDCDHRYHIECINSWLESQAPLASCPICRAEIV